MTVPAVFFQCERCGYVPSLNVMIVDDDGAILCPVCGSYDNRVHRASRRDVLPWNGAVVEVPEPRKLKVL